MVERNWEKGKILCHFLAGGKKENLVIQIELRCYGFLKFWHRLCNNLIIKLSSR